MHNFLQHLTQIDHSVITTIFHFLNSDAKNLAAVIPFEKKFKNLKFRIEANFNKKMHPEVKNIYTANWTNIERVEFFIKQNFSKYEEQLYAIIENIRYHFKNAPLNHKGIVDFPVNDPAYFEKLSKLIIPKGRGNDPRFLLAAKAIILFLFEHGEFGRRTPNDPPTLFTKFADSNNNAF